MRKDLQGIIDKSYDSRSNLIDDSISRAFDEPWYMRAANDVRKSNIGGALDYADASVGPTFEKLGGGIKTKLASSFLGELLPDNARMNLFQSGMEDVANARHRERAMSGNFSPNTVTERVLSSGLNSLAYQAPDLLAGAAAGALSGPLAPVVAPLVAGGLLYGKTAIPSEADARFERQDATGKISDYAKEQGKAEVLGELPSLVSAFAPIPGIVKTPLTAALDAAGEAWTQRMQDESNIRHNINPPTPDQRSENELVAGLSGLLGGAVQGGVMSAVDSARIPPVTMPVDESVNIYAEPRSTTQEIIDKVFNDQSQNQAAPIAQDQENKAIINGKESAVAEQPIAQEQYNQSLPQEQINTQPTENEQRTIQNRQPLVRQVAEGQIGEIPSNVDALQTDRNAQEPVQEVSTGLPNNNGAIVKSGRTANLDVPTYDPESLIETARSVMDKEFGSGWTDSLESTGRFKIIQSQPEGTTGKAKAFFNPHDNTTYFVADNISKDDDIRGLMMHEIGVHATRLGKGDVEFQDILSTVRRLRNTSAKVQEAYSMVPKDTPAELVDEEGLGYLMERHPTLPVVKRVVTWMRKAIRSVMSKARGAERTRLYQWASNLSEDDLIGMARDALRKMPDTGKQSGNIRYSYAGDKADIVNDDASSVVDPEQIKSAISNTGDFSKENQDIRYSKENEQIQSLVKQEPSILDSPIELGRKVGTALIFAPHNEIRSWNTKAGGELADLVYRATESENRVIKGPIDDIINSRFKALGRYSATLHDILGKYMRTRPLDPVSFIWHGERLPQAINDSLVNFLETGIGPKRIESTALALRQWIDYLHQYQRDAGIEIGYLENFFPHVYDTDKMEKRTVRAAFLKMLQEKHGISESTAKEIYRHIILGRGVPEMSMRGQEAESSRIQADKSGNLFSTERRALGYEGKEVRAGHTMERVLKLPYDDLKPFLVTDLASVLGRYMNASVRRAEYARAFGPNESKLNDLVRGILQELSDRGEQRISTGHVLDTVYGMADDLQGVYNPIENRLIESARRGAHQFEILTKLALVSIASMPEFLTPGAVLGQGPKAPIIGMMKGLSHAVVEGLGAVDQFVTGSRHIPEASWARAAEEVGIIYKGAIQDAISYEFGTPLSKVTSAFMKVTMLEFLTKVQKIAANETFKVAARDWAKDVSKNPNKDSHAKQMLEDFGISVDQAADWAKQGFPKDHPAFDAILSGGARFATMAVTTPTEATRSMLMKEPRLSLVFQYKAFANTFGNTFLRRMLVQMKRGKGVHKIAMLPYLAGMIAIAFAGQELKDWWYYGKNKPYASKKEEWRRWLNSVDRAGFTGAFQPLFELVSPYRYSYFDDLYVRLVGLMGPFFNDIARIGNAALKRDEKAGAKAITRMIPGTQVLNRETRKKFEKDIAKKLQ